MATFNTKKDVQRDHLKPTLILRKVIIRIDYSGVVNIDDWIRRLMEKGLNQNFKDYKLRTENSITFNFANLNEIARTLSVPVADIKSEAVKSFLNGTFADHEDNVTMEITSNFTTFVIDCKNYTNINDYLNFVNTYIASLKECQQYTIIHRLGIRKIAAIESERYDDYQQIFEDTTFKSVSKYEDVDVIVSENTDRFINTRIGVKANLTRRVRSIRKPSGKKVYQFMLDIDGYVDDEITSQTGNPIIGVFEETSKCINDYLFKLFVEETKLEYFNNNARED